MIITCPHCSKKHRIDPQRLASLTSVLKCSACGNRFRLPNRKPNASSTPAEGILRIQCGGCGKEYRIPKAKIPPGRKTVTCQECREVIFLTTPPKPTVSAEVPASEDEQPDFMAQLLTKFTKRQIVKGVGALVVLVLLIVIVPPLLSTIVSVGGRVTHSLSDTISGLTDKSDKKAQTQVVSDNQSQRAPDETEPILSLRLQGQVVMETLKALPETKTLSATLDFLQPTEVWLWLCPDAEQTVLPVLAMEAAHPQALASMLGENGRWAPYVTSTGPDQYQIDKAAVLAALPQDANRSWEELPLERYVIHLMDNQVIIVPQMISSALQDRPGHFYQCQISSFAEPIRQERDLFCCAVEVAHGLPEDWQNTIKENAFCRTFPGLSESVDTIIRENAGALAKIKRFALAYRVTDDICRMVTYTQQFRQLSEGETLYQQIKQGNLSAGKRDTGFLGIASAVCSHPGIERTVEYKESRLTVDLTWTPEDDKQILPSIKNILGYPAESSPGFQNTSLHSKDVAANAKDYLLGSLFSYRMVPEQGSREFEITHALLTIKNIRNQHPRKYGEDLASLYFGTQQGRLFELVPLELAMADPTEESQTFFKYTAKPYQGYYFKPLSTQAFTNQSLNQWRRTEGERILWTGNRAKHLTVRSIPNLMAFPAENTDPTFIYCYDADKIYMKHHQTTELTHLPEELSPDSGWVEVDSQAVMPDNVTDTDAENAVQDDSQEEVTEGL